jgi:hypothetical protein
VQVFLQGQRYIGRELNTPGKTAALTLSIDPGLMGLDTAAQLEHRLMPTWRGC